MKGRTHVVGWDGTTCKRCDLDLSLLAGASRWLFGTEVVVEGDRVRPVGPLEDPPKVCQAARTEMPRRKQSRR